jgi:hypothetical protein
MLVDKFILPEGKVYMCGHSLGPSLKTTSGAGGALCLKSKKLCAYTVHAIIDFECSNENFFMDMSHEKNRCRLSKKICKRFESHGQDR